MTQPIFRDGGWSQYAADHGLPLEDVGGEDIDQEPIENRENEGNNMTSLAWEIRTAWVEISGKVFISEDDILDELRTIYPSKVRYDHGTEDWVDETSETEKQAAFLRLAEQKARELLGIGDDPLKVYTMKVEACT